MTNWQSPLLQQQVIQSLHTVTHNNIDNIWIKENVYSLHNINLGLRDILSFADIISPLRPIADVRVSACIFSDMHRYKNFFYLEQWIKMV